MQYTPAIYSNYFRRINVDGQGVISNSLRKGCPEHREYRYSDTDSLVSPGDGLFALPYILTW
ncbi:hypothetical protein BJV82DRAFT_589687 [Fennellomyces sp. T-0311]|nr:hypothetical protein BJV82DRAFT_589687 [Fennellomyces sp. T-0311]